MSEGHSVVASVAPLEQFIKPLLCLGVCRVATIVQFLPEMGPWSCDEKEFKSGHRNGYTLRVSLENKGAEKGKSSCLRMGCRQTPRGVTLRKHQGACSL